MNESILIADDEETIQRLLVRFLQKDGYRLFSAKNGKEAVSIVKKNPVDLAILDMVMPEMDGVEALRLIKELDPTIEVLMITGKVNTHIQLLRKVIFEYGACDYLLKPFDMMELRLTIQRALNAKKIAQKNSQALQEMRNRIHELENDFKEKTFRLRESQIKYKNIVENSSDAILVIQGGYVKFANKMALELSGYSKEEILAIPFPGILHPEDRTEALEWHNRKLAENGLTPASIWRVLKKDGTALWVENQAVKSQWQDRPAILNLMRDLTRRMQDQKALLVKDAAIETSINAFAFADLEGHITYVNNSFLRMWGHGQRVDVLGKRIQSLWPDQSDFEKRLQSWRQEGGWTGEMVRVAADGNRLHLQFSVNMVTDQVERPFCIMVSFVDITRQKMIEESMVRSEKLVSLGQLSAGLAHELRNPLAVISSCSQFCLENKELEMLVKENFQVILRSSRRASNLISELLAFARPDQLKWKEVDLNEVVIRMLRMAELGVNISLMTFLKRFQKGLPKIICDEEKLGQVIVNLLQNAIQATAGEGEIVLETACSALRDRVEVSIADNGPGIPEEYRSRIFDPFFTTKGGGTGLGLSICHTIVDQHQGSISIECGDKGGTRVSVTLPVNQDGTGTKGRYREKMSPLSDEENGLTTHVEHNHVY